MIKETVDHPYGMGQKEWDNANARKMIRKLCHTYCDKTLGHIDVDEFQSIANYAIAINLPKYDPSKGSKLFPFLYRRCEHAMQDYIRQQDLLTRTERKEGKVNRLRVALDEALNYPQEVDEEQINYEEIVRKLLSYLNPVQVTIVSLIHLRTDPRTGRDPRTGLPRPPRNYTFTEASKQCGIPVQKYRQMYSQALEKMRRIAERMDGGQREEDMDKIRKAADRLFGL